jgi:hypothetical protein
MSDKEQMNDKETIALLQEQLQEAQRDKALASRVLQLANGVFFTSMDDLWKADNVRFEKSNPKTFYRKKQVNIDCYGTTACNAHAGHTLDNTSRTSAASTKTTNIFGDSRVGSQSAYLIPHSSNCSSYWFHFVPWVLKSSNIDTSYLQKCIHGFAEGNKKRNAASSTHGVAEGNKKRKVASLTPETKSNTSPKTNPNRMNGVGIKHFTTNRIRLKNQQLYLDQYPCLIIVPVMDVPSVKGWDGDGYDAIILAGGFKDISPYDVYQEICANYGIDLTAETYKQNLASKDQCEKARFLFEIAILCFCNSFCKFKYDCREESTTECNKVKSARDKLLIEGSVLVPLETKWSKETNIRLIKFNRFDNVNNPAPDPVLLLAKSVSNWLKRNDLVALPGCCDDSNCNTRLGSSDGYMCALSEEVAMRGWNTKICKNPFIEKFIFTSAERSQGSLTDSEDN